MKKNFIIYILLGIVALGASVSSKSQEQKKPSERTFAAEINKIKKIQAERAKQLEQTKTQSSENTVTNNPEPANAASSRNDQLPATTKPSSGSMRLPQKPVATKG